MAEALQLTPGEPSKKQRKPRSEITRESQRIDRAVQGVEKAMSELSMKGQEYLRSALDEALSVSPHARG